RWYEMTLWTPEMDAQLRRYVTVDGLPRSEIAKRMRKSCGSVCGRIYRLGLKLPPGVAKARQKSGLKLGSAAAAKRRKEAKLSTLYLRSTGLRTLSAVDRQD